jgi:site-specific DNA-methyltransferase (adenine-specific)
MQEILENNIYQGDCFELIKGIPDGSVDCVITDPPYGTTENKWDKKVDLVALWKELYRVAKPNAAFLFTSQMPFTVDLVNSNRKDFRYEWIWEKSQGTGFLNANKMPLKIHEQILVFYRKLPTYNPQKWQGKPLLNIKRSEIISKNYNNHKRTPYINPTGLRYPVDIIKCDYDSLRHNSTQKNKPLHPTQKPVALIEYLIKTYTNPGEVVLDCFLGSGTTAVAAINTGRKYIGLEKETEYIEMTKKNIEALQ